jgi:hypothetical protein
MLSEDFEELCCALLANEPNITRADLFHNRFDPQYGIDAFGEIPDGLQVLSAKCYVAVGKTHMAEWSDDFLNHWDTVWRDRKVSKFILAVSAPMNSPERLADIATETARFAKLGVAYEVWAPRQLQERLRGQPGLVSNYLGGVEWVERICGPIVADGGAGQAAQTDLAERLAGLGETLGGLLDARLDQLRTALDHGDTTDLEPTLLAIRQGPSWPSLAPDQQAKLIRLQGSAALNREDLAGAAAFSAEADLIASPDEPRLRAVIAWQSQGIDAGLAALGQPTTDRGRALRAGLLLNAWRLPEAREAIATLPEGDVERLRLTGHADLVAGDPAAALPVLEAALALAPNNLNNRRALAMARYAWALSPKATPDAYLQPQPQNSALVRRDDQARQALRSAHDVYSALAKSAPSPSGQEENEIWALACLCNLEGAETEAADAAGKLLARWPTNAFAIGWVIARRLAVDLEPSRVALSRALEAGEIGVNGPRALEWLTPEAQARTLKADVEVALASRTWSPAIARELVDLKDRLAGNADATAEPARAAWSAIDAALQSDDWAPVEAAFLAQVANEPGSILLLGLADALAAAGRWTLLAEHTSLILAFDTAEAIQLAALATFNAGQSAEAIEIIKQGQGHFAERRLPIVLRRVEAEALAVLGDPVEAAGRAAALAAETKSASDRLREARLRLGLGDVRGASPVIEAVLDSGELEPQQALEWSRRLASENLELARALWRKAVSQTLDDHAGASAYLLAFELGLEGERPELIGAMQRLAQAGDPSVKMVQIDELPKILEEGRARNAQIEKAWVNGRSPQHFIAQSAGVSLADILNITPDPDNRLRAVYVRHGSRSNPTPDDLPIAQWRLHMDVTALLIADQLDLLPTLEDLDEPIRIGAATLAALAEIRDKARDHQPRRGQNANRVLQAVGGEIGAVGPVEAWRVSHEPDPEAVPRQIGLADLIQGLREADAIDDAGKARLLTRLNPTEAPAHPPTHGQALIFCDMTLDQLADTDAFDTVLSTFSAFIDPASLQLSRHESARARRAAALTDRVNRLRQRIGRKLTKGAYKTVGGAFEQQLGPGATGQSLSQALKVPDDDPLGRVWFEDRHLTSYLSVGQAPIVQAVEVLQALRSARLLDEAGYFDRLLRLRDGGALFIPLTVEELDYHLAAAPFNAGELVETAALATLRRHFALSLIHEPNLKFQPWAEDDGRPLELDVVLAGRKIAQDAIQSAWSSTLAPEIAAARSTWRPPTSSTRDEVAESQASSTFTALDLAGLTSVALHVRDAPAEPRWARRSAFFEWLDAKVLSPRLSIDDALRDDVAALMRSYLRVERAEELDPELHETMRFLLATLIAQLPPILLDAVGGDGEFMASLGFGEATAVELGGQTFMASTLWEAVSAAIGGATPSVTSEDGVTCALSWSIDAPTQVTFTGGLQVQVTDSALEILSQDGARRDATINALLDEVEASPEAREALTTQLLAIDKPKDRMVLVRQLRDASVKIYLRELAQAIQSRQSFSTDRFSPPSARSVLRYLRWPEKGGVEAAVAALKADLGANAAVARAVSLPFALPDSLWSDADLRQQRSITPLAQIHRLAAMRSGAIAGSHDLAAEIDPAIAAVATYGQLFTTLLRRGALGFEAQPGWSALSAIEKHVVIWSFADRMTDMFGAIGADADAVTTFLNERQLMSATAQALVLEPGYDDSALFASSMTPAWLLLAGMEYALGEACDTITLSDPQKAALKALLTAPNDDGARVMRPVRSLAGAEPPIATWLNRPEPERFVEGAGVGEVLIEDAIHKLEVSAQEDKAWLFLHAFGAPSVSQSQRQRLGQVLAKLDLAQLLQPADDPGALLRKVADVAGRLTSGEASEGFLNALISLARAYLPPAGTADLEAKAHDFVEAGAAAARSYAGDGGDRFFRFMRAVLAVRPDTAAILRPVLDHLVDLTPVAEANDFWRALVQARAY